MNLTHDFLTMLQIMFTKWRRWIKLNMDLAHDFLTILQIIFRKWK